LSRVRVGTAGWAIPRDVADHFPAEGSALQRYAARFSAAEINSSFHRPHRPSTYARWAEAVPDGFSFAAKLPKTITHGLKLVGAEAELDRFHGEIAALGPKLGLLLVQLPPKLAFDAEVADAFLRLLRQRHDGAVALEPRHPGWFGQEAAHVMQAWRVARVAADPARVPEAAEPGGWPGLVYIRLHGSPRIYYSAYDQAYMEALAARAAASAVETWCIFDNTASGAAAGNALALRARLGTGLSGVERPQEGQDS
jgi:uncharacterized protein YecE (DUF72 family)